MTPFHIILDFVLVILFMVFSPVQTTLEAAGGFWEAITIVDSRLFIGLGVLSSKLRATAGAVEAKYHTRKRLDEGAR